MRVMIVIVLAACGPPATPSAPSNVDRSAPQERPIAVAKGTLVVDPADRTCATAADCTTVLTECSMCSGACTGVRVDRAARYAGKLDCVGYRGGICNYDCRPAFHLEEPRCRSNRCESVPALP